MPEVTRPVRPVEVNYLCDSCGHGMVRSTGDINPQTGEVPHACVICGFGHVFKWIKYPKIDFVGLDE